VWQNLIRNCFCKHNILVVHAGVAYVDLMLVHWPAAAGTGVDSSLNPELRLQTWRVLEGEVRAGRARAIGVSNFEVHHLQHLLSHAAIPPAVNQIEVHPLYQQVQLLVNPNSLWNV
jgi:2,5-diketo-D-gluconate reductase A